jgi:hypothetical protein
VVLVLLLEHHEDAASFVNHLFLDLQVFREFVQIQGGKKF